MDTVHQNREDQPSGTQCHHNIISGRRDDDSRTQCHQNISSREDEPCGTQCIRILLGGRGLRCSKAHIADAVFLSDTVGTAQLKRWMGLTKPPRRHQIEPFEGLKRFGKSAELKILKVC